MPTTPEPSRITGYLWLMDPSSSQKYVPEDHLGNTAGGPADLIVVFTAANGTEVPVPIGTSRVGSDAFNTHVDFSDPGRPSGRRVAYHYEIRFRHVPGYRPAPTWILNGGINTVAGRQYKYHWWEITYDPNRYQYATIRASTFDFADDNTGEVVHVPLRKVEGPPSPDFPNDYIGAYHTP